MSFHSNNVGSASNMIPCFPTSNDTDAHHCETISNRSSPSHFTKDSPSNIYPKSEPGISNRSTSDFRVGTEIVFDLK